MTVPGLCVPNSDLCCAAADLCETSRQRGREEYPEEHAGLRLKAKLIQQQVSARITERGNLYTSAFKLNA